LLSIWRGVPQPMRGCVIPNRPRDQDVARAAGDRSFGHPLIVVALLLVASTPLLAEGYDGPWLASQAWHFAGALANLGLLAQIVTRTASAAVLSE
jgi:hypothetical protein